MNSLFYMGESQSRYSIVERLTSNKIEKSQKGLENWKKDIIEDNKREQRKRELEIEKAIQEAGNFKEMLSEREKVYDEQIKAIEDALKSIEEISKTSPTIQ